METVTCNEFGCEKEINPKTMQYGKDFYVLINLTNSEMSEIGDITDLYHNGLVGIYCKNCAIIIMAEVQANGFEVVSRKQV